MPSHRLDRRMPSNETMKILFATFVLVTLTFAKDSDTNHATSYKELKGKFQKALIEIIQLEIGKYHEDLSYVTKEVLSVKTDVSSVKTDVSSVKTDMSSVKTDVSSVKTDVASLKAKQIRCLSDSTDVNNRYQTTISFTPPFSSKPAFVVALSKISHTSNFIYSGVSRTGAGFKLGYAPANSREIDEVTWMACGH